MNPRPNNSTDVRVHERTGTCVLLADPHQGLVEGIRHLLEKEFEVVLMAADAKSLDTGIERLQPTLLVVELSLLRTKDKSMLGDLRCRQPGLKVIVLSMHDEPSIVRSVMDAGANGYLLKAEIASALLNAVHDVMAGHTFVSPGIRLSAHVN